MANLNAFDDSAVLDDSADYAGASDRFAAIPSKELVRGLPLAVGSSVVKQSASSEPVANER